MLHFSKRLVPSSLIMCAKHDIQNMSCLQLLQCSAFLLSLLLSPSEITDKGSILAATSDMAGYAQWPWHCKCRNTLLCTFCVAHIVPLKTPWGGFTLPSYLWKSCKLGMVPFLAKVCVKAGNMRHPAKCILMWVKSDQASWDSHLLFQRSQKATANKLGYIHYQIGLYSLPNWVILTTKFSNIYFSNDTQEK